MISKRLNDLFGISTLLFILHGLEEYFNNFYNIDSHSKFLLKPFLSITDYQTSFLTFQIILWTVLLLVYFSKKLPVWLAIFIGLIYIYELHHIIKAIQVGGYYPGLISALGFPVIAFLYWKELIKQFQKQVD